jgi:hypothetical protein
MFKFGIDWSENHHNLCIRNDKGAIVSQIEFKHTAARTLIPMTPMPLSWPASCTLTWTAIAACNRTQL